MLSDLLSNDLLSAIVAFVVVLIPAVLIHELGHFLAAKSVGITILEFGIGFPPRIMKLFTWGETEFTLNWLPLGGFVRPLGEDMIRPLTEAETQQAREELESRQGQPTSSSADTSTAESGHDLAVKQEPAKSARRPMSVAEAKPWPRIFFMAAGALANFVSAWLLFVVIAVIGISQEVGARVNVVDVPAGTALASAGLQNDDVIEAINGETFSTPQAFFEQLHSLEEPTTVTVRRGEADEIIELTVPAAREQADAVTENPVRIMGVVRGAPADQAGMLPGDLIIAFNGASLTANADAVTELQQLTRAHVGEEVTVTLVREERELDVQLVPRANPPEGQGAMGIVIQAAHRDVATGILYQEGVPQQAIVSQPFGEAARFATERFIFWLDLVIRLPAEVIGGTLSPEVARPVGFIGISQVGGQLLQRSIAENQPTLILNYIAIISILLGFFNLLPLPALDGGRIFFVLIELVRGRPVSPEREGLVHLIGLALLLSVSVVITLNDIFNPINAVQF